MKLTFINLRCEHFFKNDMQLSKFFCLQRRTDKILLYSEAFYRPKEGVKLFQERASPPFQKKSPKEKMTTLLKKKIFFLKLKQKVFTKRQLIICYKINKTKLRVRQIYCKLNNPLSGFRFLVEKFVTFKQFQLYLALLPI